MAKRARPSDVEMESPPSKIKCEDADDGGGRTGRVRKKSAKVLEMEEFEQVEKTHHGTKKPKTPKGPTQKADSDGTPPMPAPPKPKTKDTPAMLKSTLATNLMQAPISVTPVVSVKSSKASKSSESNATEMLAAVMKNEPMDEDTDKPKESVIKTLLNSPSAGSKMSDNASAEISVKRSTSKKQKVAAPAEKSGANVKVGKVKSAKVKLELDDAESEDLQPTEGVPSLKMRILASSDPGSAQVTLNPDDAPGKSKKSTKKTKGNAEAAEVKKALIKKEKLIQEAITAAQKMPISDSPQVSDVKNVKKKKKIKIIDHSSSAMLGSASVFDEDGGEESNLVIAETEMKKKKTLTKKKSPKEKGAPGEAKADDENGEKKVSKRAPTAYMLFCNTHRPDIVRDNPGIDFAAISRKLGEMWQTLSTKQKLQWRRKAQRRMKKGSNLISTGKAAKEPTVHTSGVTMVHSGPAASPQSGSSLAQSGNAANLAAVRFLNMANRSPTEPPQSPTKANFSIEPVDVAAHLKLLGESLSIIGMRLQEHKGMIAVQGSLSVLLDSLLCACGPLLCLTQQVPNMDGCDPVIHGQTLDSVAYVMPGL